MNHSLQSRCISMLLLLVLSCTAAAETARRDDGDNALRKAQYMLRQLSQEKTDLQATNAKLEGDLQVLQKQFDELQAKLDKTEQHLDKSRDSNEQLVGRIRRDNERLTDLMEKQRDTLAILQAAKQDNQLLVNAVQERDGWIQVCRGRNEGMYQANLELLDRYQHKGVLDAVRQKEPLTGIPTVQLENEVQEYRFRLEDLQVSRFEPEASRR